MRRTTGWMAILLTTVVLAGCAKPTSEARQADAALDAGTLRGLVVDAAIRPLPGVDVQAEGAGQVLRNQTGPDGLFTFTGAPAGAYVVTASRIGYFAAKATADVHAGEETSLVKLVLEPDIANMPYVQSQVAEGFIDCSTSVVQVCGSGNALSDVACMNFGVCAGNVTSGQYFGDMFFASNASLLQFELFWTPTQSLGNQLFLQIVPYGDTCTPPPDSVGTANETMGTSPLLAKVALLDVAEWNIGGGCFLRWQVFPGGAEGLPCAPTQPLGTATDVCVGATAQQSFRIVMHEFHGYAPPETWRFSSDGDPPAPP